MYYSNIIVRRFYLVLIFVCIHEFSLAMDKVSELMIYRCSDEECSICFDIYEPESLIGLLKCRHFTCSDCIKRMNSCPICRSSFHRDEVFHIEFKNINDETTRLDWRISVGDEQEAITLVKQLKEYLPEDEFIELINNYRNKGGSILHFAILKRWQILSTLLINSNMDTSIQGLDGLAPYELADKKSFFTVTKLLRPNSSNDVKIPDFLWRPHDFSTNYHWFSLQEKDTRSESINFWWGYCDVKYTF